MAERAGKRPDCHYSTQSWVGHSALAAEREWLRYRGIAEWATQGRQNGNSRNTPLTEIVAECLATHTPLRQQHVEQLVQKLPHPSADRHFSRLDVDIVASGIEFYKPVRLLLVLEAQVGKGIFEQCGYVPPQGPRALCGTAALC